MISAKRGQPPEYDPPRVTEIRDAIREDAPAACEVIRRSISELCGADHRNDPEILGRWLANKTQEIVGSWIIKPGNSVLVAVDDNSILAVGAVTDAGEITLNYVSPDVRFRGVSRAMLTALEARTLERGTDRCTLLSTPKRLIAFTGLPVISMTALHKGNSAQRRATRCQNDSPDK